ncbi:MAG: DMT family transporter [Desulfobacterales bacterium]|nr:DMT family transporter [Desulfobacterales bacterium]
MDRFLGVFLIILSALFSSTLAIFACLAYQAGTNPITLLFLRFSIAGVFMILVMAAQGVAFPRGRTLIVLIAMGALFYVSLSLSFFTALTMAPAGLVVILLYLYPAFVTILTAIFLKKPVTTFNIVALLLSFIGIVFIVGLNSGKGQILGILLAILTALLFAIYLVLSHKSIIKAGALSATTVLTFSAGIVFGGIVAVKGVEFPVTMAGWVYAVAVALIPTVLAFLTLFAGLKRIEPPNAAIILTMEPVIAVVLAAVILGETITPVKILGGMMILSAVILLARSEVKTVSKTERTCD